MKKENTPIREEFKQWFYSRGEFYQKLEMKFFKDGEPYFSSQGAECSLRDYERRKELVKDIFTCKYISGSGTEYDGGIWQKKETPKTIIFKQLKKSFYQPNWTKLRIIKDKMKNRRHCLQDWNDGTYTIYPDRCGTPHIFESIKPEEIEKIIEELNRNVGKNNQLN